MGGFQVRGHEVIVDDDIYDLVAGLKWHLSVGYPTTSTRIRLHNIVQGCPLWGMHTDHINQNKLDNRRENLRTVEPWFNHQNYGAHSDAGSRHRGVSWSVHNKGWIAQSMVRGKRVHLGTFKSEDDAASAVNIYRRSQGLEC